MDPRHYCQPPADAPYCTTSTWQYSTEDAAGARTSHWVGVKRSCATSTTTHGTEIDATGNNRAASNLKENVRFYAPANTAAKAKDNARYPTSDSANNIPYTIANSDNVLPLEPQFMTSDGTGAPDLPTTLVTPELECISCVTPIGNTDSTVSPSLMCPLRNNLKILYLEHLRHCKINRSCQMQNSQLQFCYLRIQIIC